MIVLGVANLCAQKWNEESFKYHALANEIKSTLAHCAMKNSEIGMTYLADRVNKIKM